MRLTKGVNMTARRMPHGTGTIAWYVDFTYVYPDGRKERVRKHSPVQTKVGAEAYERQLRNERLNPTGRIESPTLLHFVENEWLPTYPASAGNRKATIREKKKHWTCHIRNELGRFRLHEIDKQRLDTFNAVLVMKELSSKYRRNINATLRKVLVTAVEWKKLAALPQFPRIKVEDTEWDWFTAEETKHLLRHARNPEEYALLLFPFDTGARAGEQLAFEWGDIDWRAKKIGFKRAYSEGELGPTKSGKTRWVPLTSELEKALRAIKHLKGKLVFSNPDGSEYSLWQLHERFEGCIRRAGLRRIKWHDTRHSFASQLVTAGVSLRQVQEYLGHSTIAMTMRYAHLAPNNGDEMRTALDRQGSCAAAV